MSLDDENVRDLLFGDTDVRNLALFLAQQGLTMDAQEREQRRVIFDALVAHRNGKVARWTRTLAVATFVLAGVTLLVAIGTFIIAAKA